MAATTCQWCGAAMPPSRQPKRFCSAAHRARFHEGCRKLGERMFVDGAVSIEQLREEVTK